MPIRYLRRSGKRLYGTNGKRRKSGRTTRAYRGKGRSTRRYSRKMTKKQILNITAYKKRDKMRVVAVTSYGTAGTKGNNLNLPVTPGNDVTGQRINMLPFTCTARPSLSFQRYNEADRTATTCYMRGYHENVRLVLPDANEWVWRRICFTYRGPNISSLGNAYYFDTTGVYRYAYDASDDSATQSQLYQQRMYTILFLGTYQQDWDDPMVAPLDGRRIGIKMDRIRYLKSGNDQPVEKIYKDWLPMNKNLTYDDDQNGPTESSAPYSVSDKRGMGDYYIIDLLRCTNPNAPAANKLFFQPSGTLYWHEK